MIKRLVMAAVVVVAIAGFAMHQANAWSCNTWCSGNSTTNCY